MNSLGVVERPWDGEDGRMSQVPSQQQSQQPSQSQQFAGMGAEYGMGGGSAFMFAPHLRSNFTRPGERRRPQSFGVGATPPSSQLQPTPTPTAQWPRHTELDFELLLQEGGQPTDEMRRSLAYVKWYNVKRLQDPRIPPPLNDIRYGQREPIMEAPWDGVSAVRMPSHMTLQGTGNMNITSGATGESGKGGVPRLELDASNLLQAHEQQTFNPYAAGFQRDENNMLSPGTQFFGAYAPTPLATTATPNTLRAYAHSRMNPQNQSGSVNNEGESSQTISKIGNQNIYNNINNNSNNINTNNYHNEWNATEEFRTGPTVITNMSQQYYTQEPINPFEYYNDSAAVASYYGPAAGSVADATRMHPSLMGMGGPAGEMGGMMRGGNGRGRRGGGGGGGGGGNRGRGAGSAGGKWGGGVNAGKVGGRGGGAYREPLQPCSEILERFRADAMNGATSHWRIGHITGHALEFAQDQEGSRFIQRAVDNATHDELDAIFREIFESPLELVTDIFGNYVLQKLLDVGNPSQLVFAATRLQNNVVSLTLQTYGCRVIQKCIEVMPSEGLNILLAELKGNVAKCIQDQNGNHVVQKCVEVVPQRCGFIVSAFTGRVMELATHAYGCRVIQCIMEHCPDQEEAIFSELLQCVGTLAKDQYGNYVIQHVLEHMKDENKIGRIFDALKGDFYEFSKQKFASNVMEKIFIRANPQQRMELVHMLSSPLVGIERPHVEVLTFKRTAPVKKESSDKHRGEFAKKGRRDREREREKENAGGLVIELQSGGKEAPSMLCLMMDDPYANYVVQRLLDAADIEQFWCIIDNIQKFLRPIITFKYGAPIIQRLARRQLVMLPEGVTLNLSLAETSSGKGN